MLYDIDERRLEDWITEKRREFHRIPELSFYEFKTQEKIMEILHEIDLEGRSIANTGVVATIQGRSPGSTIAIRADMDALNITEKITAFNKEYISQHNGFMHSCGHDGHMAMVLGAAKLLMQRRETFSGSIRLIFQPGEELPPGGALAVIEDGGLEGVDAIVGMHIFSIIDSGEIKFKPGPMLAAANVITIKFNGKGGHYVRPESCIDPIFIACRFISCIQIEIQKRLSDKHFILGFGKISGGSQSNWIPDTVEISGTYRTFNHDDTKLIEETIRHTLDNLMVMYSNREIPGLPTYELDILYGYPVLVNDPVFSRRALSVLKRSFPVVSNEIDPHFGADDFAYYLEKIPGLYILLGTRNLEKGITEGNHSSRFEIDEEILIRGAHALITIALDFLENPGKYSE
jgi:amidohydrolase